MIKYSIVIPTFNHCDDLLKPCVESVLKHSRMSEIQLIVVANGCTDNTKWYLDRLAYQFSSLGFEDHFSVVWHDQPLGFSKACNAGITIATADKIVLLNNDVVLLDQQRHSWLQKLHEPFVQNSNTGITSTLKLFSKETGRSFAVFFCVMIDRKVIDKIGLLNEEFGVGGGEDIEFCLLAENAGFVVTSVANTEWSPVANTNVSNFPIWHKAEGTMHDAQLVPEWHTIFQNNMRRLQQKYGSHTSAISIEQAVDKYSWLRNHNQESEELFDEVFVKNVYRVSPSVLENHLVLDIGANQGMFAILSASMGAKQVIAVEPVGSTHQLLCDNVNKSGLQNIECLKKAVCGKPTGPVAIGIHEKSGHNSLYQPGNSSELVETVTLETLIKQNEQLPIFLKMDCEGAEYDILFDSDASVFDRVKHIAVEIHGDLHPTRKGIDMFQHKLKQLGFKNEISNQIGVWWYNSEGQVIRFDPMPVKIDIWTKP